jgi:hypothetical protein
MSKLARDGSARSEHLFMLLIFIKLYTSHCFIFILFNVLILFVIKLISQTKMSESQVTRGGARYFGVGGWISYLSLSFLP